jgi:hypothetical protein
MLYGEALDKHGLKFQFGARYGGSYLEFQLLRRQRLGGWSFVASPDKKLARFHLYKKC